MNEKSETSDVEHFSYITIWHQFTILSNLSKVCNPHRLKARTVQLLIIANCNYIVLSLRHFMSLDASLTQIHSCITILSASLINLLSIISLFIEMAAPQTIGQIDIIIILIHRKFYINIRPFGYIWITMLYCIFNLLFTPYRVVLRLIIICSIGIIRIFIYIFIHNVLHYGLNSILTDHKALFLNVINPLSINLSLSVYIDQFKKC